MSFVTAPLTAGIALQDLGLSRRGEGVGMAIESMGFRSNRECFCFRLRVAVRIDVLWICSDSRPSRQVGKACGVTFCGLKGSRLVRVEVLRLERGVSKAWIEGDKIGYRVTGGFIRSLYHGQCPD